MKCVKLFVCVVTALLLSSCTGVEMDVMNDVKYPVILHAGHGALHTRIGIEGTKISWEPDDVMDMTAVAADGSYANSILTVFSIDEADARKASFSGFVTMPSDAPEYCYFTYPTGSSMEVDSSNGLIKVIYSQQDGKHKPYLYAEAEYDEAGMSVHMNHVGAVLEIALDEELAGTVAQISFVGNSLETLSPLTVDPSTGECSFSSEVIRQITVNVQPEGRTYISVPPVRLDKGFTLVCSTSDGTRSMLRSFSSDGTSSGGYDFSSKVGHIIPIRLEGTFEDFAVSCEAPAVAHTLKDGLLNGTSVTFRMNKQGIPDKLIEEWGAHLFGPDQSIVRSSVIHGSPIDSQDVVMDIMNDWKLLPAGTYTFAPYYKYYGQKRSLPTSVIEIADPGVVLKIDGCTSYDRYISGDPAAANRHQNTLIEALQVSINVHPDIIDYRKMTFDGGDISPVTDSGSQLTYGNLTRNEFREYPMIAEFKVGAMSFRTERDFHLTGLPIEADFRTGDPSTWQNAPQWGFLNASYENRWVSFRKGTNGILSPGFHVPSTTAVMFAVDAHTNSTDATDKIIHFNASPSDAGSIITSSSVTFTPNYSSCMANKMSSQGYGAWMSGISLTSANNSLMISNVIDSEPWYFLNQTRVAIFQFKIHYKE